MKKRVYIALLRGINVGGKRPLPMTELRKLFEEEEYLDVKTYIQSGNVVFASEGKEKVDAMQTRLEQAIKERFAYEVPVMVIPAEEWERATASNPFILDKKEEINDCLIIILNKTPDKKLVSAIKNPSKTGDKFNINGRYIYLLNKGPFHKSKLSIAFFEKNLEVKATARNWKTVMKLYGMLG